MSNYLLPHSFKEINETFKDKIKEDYGINDTVYYGSNVSILSNILSYISHMTNTNMNFGVNEMIISKATTKKNIITLARELGYEPQRKRSFQYRIRLKANTTGVLRIPMYTKFKSGEKSFVYVGQDTEQKFGTSATLDIRDRDRFKELYARKGDIPGSLVVTNDGEVLEVLEKTTMTGGERLLLNNITSAGEQLSLYSNTPTALYKRDDVTGDMIRVANIETFIVDDTDKDNIEFIIQLKDIDPVELPADPDEVVKLKFYTDDCEYHRLTDSFEGFGASSYNPGGEILKFKVAANYVTIDGVKKYINDLVTLYRRKQVAAVPADVDDNIFLEDRIIGKFVSTENVDECVLEVKEGEILDYNEDKNLVVTVDAEMQEKGYIPLEYRNIEQDGIFLEISRVDYKSELVLKQPWHQRETYIAPHLFKGEDTSFVVLTDYIGEKDYLKVYTAYANSGTKFYAGNIFYFKLLKTSGSQGASEELMSIEDSEVSNNFTVIPYIENKDDPSANINHILVTNGADEEDIESIRINAPLYNNLAQRIVTKHDYLTFCRKFQFVEQSAVWGGEELEAAPRLGHIFFSFIPKSRITDFIPNDNATVFNLKNSNARDLFFLPEEQIIMEEDGGRDTSIFEQLSKNKIITLQYHYEPPSYLDFILEVRIIKYILGKSNKELREEIFEAAREYFTEVEHFETEIYKSNIIKYIDKKLNNNSGIDLRVYLETTIERDDFINVGPATKENAYNFYEARILFQFPINGVFEDSVVSYTGEILEHGKLIKDRLPGIFNKGSFGEGVTLSFDYDKIKYRKSVDGIITELEGTETDIDSSTISFHIPMILDTTGADPLSPYPKEKKQIGWMQVYCDKKMIYIQIDATDSDDPDDLENRANISYFNEKRVLGIENEANLTLKRNTFPRLKRVEIVDEIE